MGGLNKKEEKFADQRTGRFIKQLASKNQSVKGVQMENERKEKDLNVEESQECQEPMILEEVNIEELAVDGICGIY